jgi:hypothetical protein
VGNQIVVAFLEVFESSSAWIINRRVHSAYMRAFVTQIFVRLNVIVINHQPKFIVATIQQKSSLTDTYTNKATAMLFDDFLLVGKVHVFCSSFFGGHHTSLLLTHNAHKHTNISADNSDVF